ncbi:hypothetical protein DEJ03_14055, partial [Curtobacterium sp. MCLR17_043]
MLAVCDAVTVNRPSASDPRAATHRPSAPTRAVCWAEEPDTDSSTVDPGYPVPETVPPVGPAAARVGGTMTSEAGALATGSAATRSRTVKTCCGPERTVPRQAQEPFGSTRVVHPDEPVAAGPVTRTVCPGVPVPWKRVVPVVTSPGSAMVGRTAGRVGVGVGAPGRPGAPTP